MHNHLSLLTNTDLKYTILVTKFSPKPCYFRRFVQSSILNGTLTNFIQMSLPNENIWISSW